MADQQFYRREIKMRWYVSNSNCFLCLIFFEKYYLGGDPTAGSPTVTL